MSTTASTPHEHSDPLVPLTLHSEAPHNTDSRPEVTVVDGTLRFNRAAYDQGETAMLLGGVTRQHVGNLIRAGELRAAKLGRRVVVPATEIARILIG